MCRGALCLLCLCEWDCGVVVFVDICVCVCVHVCVCAEWQNTLSPLETPESVAGGQRGLAKLCPTKLFASS